MAQGRPATRAAESLPFVLQYDDRQESVSDAPMLRMDVVTAGPIQTVWGALLGKEPVRRERDVKLV